MRVIGPFRRPIRLISSLRPSPEVVKLIVDGYSRGNHKLSTTGGILRDHHGMVLAAFGFFFFLGHQRILYIKLMAIFEGLKLVAQLGNSILEVESDSATVVS